jgi:hypothetical protein
MRNAGLVILTLFSLAGSFWAVGEAAPDRVTVRPSPQATEEDARELFPSVRSDLSALHEVDRDAVDRAFLVKSMATSP